MSFQEKIPTWNAAGVEPPDTLKNTGFTPGYKPPAAYFNWFLHSVGKCLEELQNMEPSDIGALRTIQSIADNTDLNNLTTPGFYYCIADAKVREYTNCPTTYAFYLEVGKHAGTYQRLVEYGTQVAKTYYRNLYAGSWGEWKRIYTTDDNPTAEDVGAVSQDTEVLSTTSVTAAAVAQASGTIKHYALSGDSYTGSDLPADGYRFGNATVIKRYAMATVILWGGPNISEISINRYNNGWAGWKTFITKDSLPLSIGNGGTGATNAEDAAKALMLRSTINASNPVDANTLVSTGIHMVYLEGNTGIVPQDYNFPYYYGVLVVWRANAYVAQAFYAVSANKLYFRTSTGSGSVWGDWKRLTADSEVISRKLLWTNPSPSADFAAQDITISGLGAYDGYEVIFATNMRHMSSGFIPSPSNGSYDASSAMLQSICNMQQEGLTAILSARSVSFVNAPYDLVAFGDAFNMYASGTSTSQKDNKHCKPILIYGIKGVL